MNRTIDPRAIRFSLTAMLTILSLSKAPLAMACPATDDFEDGTTQGWAHGGPSPNPPTNMATGGPAGAGDAWLQVHARGGFRPGGRLVAFNRMQWSGDLASCGLAVITADVSNQGAGTLYLRIGIQGALTRFVSSTAIEVSSAVWTRAIFLLSESDMTRTGGSADFATALASVSEVRIISASSPTWQGDDVEATLGLDNVTAQSAPTGVHHGPVIISSWGGVKIGSATP